MKIEFLSDISDGGRFPDPDPAQLVRIYHFNTLQADKLRQVIQKTIVEDKEELNLSTLDFVQPVNCDLTLKTSETDRGIITSDNKAFVCLLTPEKYREMIFLIEPFCDKEMSGYQWLYDLDTPIDFLFSRDGSW